MEKLVLGLDVGISSVGWGIIDVENSKVIDCGVRIFAEGNSTLNEERRNFRSARRLLRRRQHRVERIRELLIQNNIITEDFKAMENPYIIRKKGLSKKLTNEELATAILHIAKRRGVSGNWVVSDDADKIKSDKSVKATLKRNAELLQNKYVCEIQLNNLDNDNSIRGIHNTFTTEDYKKELLKIFENQSLDNNLTKEIIKIIESKREYYEGPGSKKSPTIYGRFYEENGEIIEVDLIEKMRGRCSIYPEELRAPKMCYSAELFNLLNDLNNIDINGEAIDINTKKEIINIVNEKGKFTYADLKKILGAKDEDIYGCRINKKDKCILTEFKGYQKILKYVNDNNLNKIIYENKDLCDSIIEVLTSKKGEQERVQYLKEKYSDLLSNNDISYLSVLGGFTEYHSLSLKIIKEIENELIETSNNQMQIFAANGYFENKIISYKGLKNIPFNDELILSGVAKRSQREAIKIVNAVRKKYGELNSVVIEMAREKNSEDQIKIIKSNQKNGELMNKLVEGILGGRKANTKLRHKIRLYLEQGPICPYSGEEIKLDRLINDPTAYEIDHIIPLSISFNDSFQNKALVTWKSNQAKGQRTPYQYFKNKTATNWNYEDFQSYVLKNDSIPWKKKYNYIYEKDINKYEIRKEFINRNLVDTRYASKGILNTLQDYFKENEIETIVSVINGQITHYFRKNSSIEKNRDEDYRHHTIDALIVAGIKKMNYFNKLLEINNDTESFDVLADEKDYKDEKFMRFLNNLVDIEVKYSHKVDKKYNRTISDATIYGTRIINNEEVIISKLRDIYGPDGERLAKLFKENKAQDKLLMYKHDKATFEHLKKVYLHYVDEKNPFLKYKEENNDFIRKQHPNENKNKTFVGVPIKSLRYINKCLVSHINISENYPKPLKGKVVLLSINPFRIDVYKDADSAYKFLKVDHYQIKQSKNKYYIDKELYKEESERRMIFDDAEFLFSLSKGDLFYYEKGDEKQLVKYNGTDYNSNKIEYKPLNKYSTDQYYLTIGKQINNIHKVHSDILGNLYKVGKETCKFEL